MDMLNRLTAVVADVGDDTVSVFETALGSDLRDNLEYFCDNVAVFGSYFVSGLNVVLGDNDNVNGSLRSDIVKSQDIFVFISLI